MKRRYYALVLGILLLSPWQAWAVNPLLFSPPKATTTAAGISERCTDAEMTAGTKTDCAVTPANAKVELDKKQASDANLTAIAALACTENQIIKRNGAGAWACADLSAAVSGKVCKTITNPSAADTNILFDTASARTVTKLWAICIGGTSVVATLQNGGSDYTGTTQIATVTADTNGASQTSIDSASLTNGDYIRLVIGTVTGVVTQLMVCYE
jgi:hypothetical protein